VSEAAGDLAEAVAQEDAAQERERLPSSEESHPVGAFTAGA
jgi:hypothetical protein